MDAYWKALAGNFTGRTEELKWLRHFCAHGQGTLLLFGSPGIGKSSLVVQWLKEMQAASAQYPPAIPFFIRRGTRFADNHYFLTYLNSQMDRIFDLTDVKTGSSIPEMWENLNIRLKRIENQKSNKQAVLLIDGLDENPDILTIIPGAAPFFKIILTSRPSTEVLNWYDKLETNNKQKYEVKALSESNVMAIIHNFTAMHHTEWDELCIKRMADKCEGNPLYLKLFCDMLLTGKQPKDEIPEGTDNLYQEIIERIVDSSKSATALEILILLSVTFASLPVRTISAFLKTDTRQIESALCEIRELLMADVESGSDYFQLFHESLREWLQQNHKEAYTIMSQSVMDYCFNWNDIREQTALRYALQYTVRHLAGTRDYTRLYTLMFDEPYRNKQIEEFKNYTVSMHCLKKALEVVADSVVEKGTDRKEWLPRFSRLTMRAGELGKQAKTDFSIAWDWMQKRALSDISRVKEALERISVLDDTEFYTACLKMILIEAFRQEEAVENDKSHAAVRLIMDRLNTRIPPGSMVVSWRNFLSIEWMVGWLDIVLTSFNGNICNDFFKVIRRTDKEMLCYFIESFLKNTGSRWVRLLVASGDVALNSYANYLVIEKITAVILLSGDIKDKAAFIDKLTATIDGMENEYNKALALLKIINAALMVSAHSIIKKIYGQVIVKVNGIKDNYRKSEILALLLEAAFHIPEVKNDILGQALDTAIRVEEDYDKSAILTQLAECLFRNQRTDKAWEVLQRMADICRTACEDKKLNWFQSVYNILNKDISIPVDFLGNLVRTAVTFQDEFDKTEALTLLIGLIIHVRPVQEFRKLFDELSGLADEAEDEYNKAALLEHLAAALMHFYKGAGNFDRLASDRSWIAIIQYMNNLKEEDQKEDFYTFLVEQLLKKEDVENALGFYALVNDPLLKSRMLAEITAVLSKYGETERALEYANQAADGYFKGLALISVSEALIKKGENGRAAELLVQTNTIAAGLDVVARPKITTRVVYLLAGIRRFDTVSDMAADTEEAGKPAVKAIMVHALLDAGETERAIGLVDLLSWNAGKSEMVARIYKALKNKGETGRARKLLLDALDPAVPPVPAKNSKKTLCLTADAWLRIARFDESITTCLAMEDDCVKYQYLLKVIKALQNQRESENKKRIIMKIIKNITPVTTPAEMLFGVEPLAADEADDRENLLIETVKSVVTENYREIPAKIKETVNLFENPYFKARVYVKISEVLFENKQAETARDFIDCALENAERIESAVQKSGVYSKIALVTAAYTGFDAALPAMERITDDYYMVETLAAENDEQKVLSGLKRAMKITDRINSDWKRGTALKAIVRSVKSNANLPCLDLLAQLSDMTDSLQDDSDKIEVFFAIAAVYREFRMSEPAKETVKKNLNITMRIKPDWKKAEAVIPGAAFILEHNMDESDLWEQIIMCVKAISDDTERTKTYIKISALLFEHEYREKALEWLTNAADAVNGITDPDVKSLFFTDISGLLYKMGETGSSAAWINQAIESALLITPDNIRFSRLSIIAEAVIMKGDWEKAFQITGFIEDGWEGDYKAATIGFILQTLIRNGNMDVYRQYLLNNIFPDRTYKLLLTGCYSTLAESNLINNNTNDNIRDIIRTIPVYPFNYELNFHGMSAIIICLIGENRPDIVAEIKEASPNLRISGRSTRVSSSAETTPYRAAIWGKSFS